MVFNWKDCTLGDVITLQRGFDLPSSKRQDGKVPVVSSSGISGYHNVAKVKAPGVVTGRYGTLGEVFHIDQDFWPLNTTLYVKNFKDNDHKFISYFLKTLNLAHQNTAGAVPGLNRNALHLLPVKIPSLPTQKKIAAILSAYDDLIENNTRHIKILEEMAETLYHEWFVKFRFPGHEHTKMVDSELGLIPESWEVASFTDIADILSGGTPKTKILEYWNGNIPFFTPKDAPDNFYVTETEKSITEIGLSKCNSKLYPKNIVFITARGTVGKAVMAAVDMAMNQSCFALRGKDEINQYFVLLTIKNHVQHLQKAASGATFDAIIIDTFRRLLVIKPDILLINTFGHLMSPMFDLVLNLIQKNSNLRR
ncbi:MAG: restriction endonuclease subunit S [Nostoc sp.]|uniref:restriction endonuclease subunit S n=1 Tax=Nostoc sp. TaxID=1180 RepID=UPI002FF5C08B